MSARDIERLQNFASHAFRMSAHFFGTASHAVSLNPFMWPARDMLDTARHHSIEGVTTKVRPAFAIPGAVEVRETQSAFADLIHFDRKSDRLDPHILVVPPMSGHHPTILRGTIKELLPHHDISLIDWKPPSEIPLEAGAFDLKRNVAEIIRALENCGPQSNVIAVSQSTIPSLIALTLMSIQGNTSLPRSITFIGGPFCPSAAPTELMSLVRTLGPEWFKEHDLRLVGPHSKGQGRQIYPAEIQNFALSSPHIPNRILRMGGDFWLAAMGFGAPRSEDADFTREHRAIADIPGELFIDMIKHFCHEDLLKGQLSFDGHRIDLSKLSGVRVFTVEGGSDDISAPGQTENIHNYLTSIAPKDRFNLLAEGASHYDIFHGHHWRDIIAPKVTAFIRHQPSISSVAYSPVPPSHLELPASYSGHDNVVSFTSGQNGAHKNRPGRVGAGHPPEARLKA